METLKLKVISNGPALMASERLVNPNDPITKELAKYTGKRKKTEEDNAEILRLKFLGSLYYDDSVGIYWPGINLWASLRDGAKLSKRGQQIIRGAIVLEEFMPLKYKGPKEPEKLYKDPMFVDVRSGVLSGRRVMTCRPIFREWECEATIVYDSGIVNHDDLISIANDAGQFSRMGTFRQRFGRYTVEEIAA